MSVVVALDVGGSTIKAAVVDERGDPHELSTIPTPHDPSGRALVTTLAAHVCAVHSRVDVAGVGIALPGIVDVDAELAVLSANLGWRDVPMGTLLRAELDLPIAIGHDIRAGALAEARFGALRGRAGRALFAAVGTGLSVAVVDNGEVPSSDPWQGEIGQLLVPNPQHPDADLVPIETIASAAGIARAAGVASAQEVLARAGAGEQRARRAWEDGIDTLGAALAASVAVLGATHVVVGGGLATAHDALFAPLERAIASRLPSARRPTLAPAELGPSAGCIGAGILIHDLLSTGRAR